MFVCILYVVNLVFINQMDRVMLIRGKYTLVQKSNYFIYIFHSKCLLFTLKVVVFHLLLKFKTSKNNIFMLFGVGSNGRKIWGHLKDGDIVGLSYRTPVNSCYRIKCPPGKGKHSLASVLHLSTSSGPYFSCIPVWCLVFCSGKN